jgi:hypothetical protein
VTKISPLPRKATPYTLLDPIWAGKYRCRKGLTRKKDRQKTGIFVLLHGRFEPEHSVPERSPTDGSTLWHTTAGAAPDRG